MAMDQKPFMATIDQGGANHITAPRQPVRLDDGRYFIPGRDVIVGFGDEVSKETKVETTSTEGNLSAKWMISQAKGSALEWLYGQVEEICALGRV